MLHEFLVAERAGILALCEKKFLSIRETKTSSEEMERALSVFYDELIEVLRADEEEDNDAEASDIITKRLHSASAKRRGKESLRLGYTISQVVQGYGSLCQSITEFVGKHSSVSIHAREFNRLNFCLDVATAEAVKEFSQGQGDTKSREEAKRLGFLAHELRNALSTVASAHRMIQRGVVGFSGSTSKVLEDGIRRMKDIIDRSLSEVRMQGDPLVENRRFRVVDLVGEVETTAELEAKTKSIGLTIDVAPELVIDVDRHLLISAISNLVQNAIKFTKQEGTIRIRAKAVGNRILIEVEDECGGLPRGKIEELFQPFLQKGADRSGVGLGLSIARRAVALNKGELSARDIPGKGCAFTIELPRAPVLPGETEGFSTSIN